MPGRSYRQYCAFARALDVVGDRWNLLIVRNLLLGPQSWSQLRAGLPGIAKNLLSERLKQLGADGVVEHSGELYALTPCGAELEQVVFALADWGERHFMGPPADEDAFRLRYLMTSVRRKLQATSPGGSVQVFVGSEPFWVRLGTNPTVEQGVRVADASISCTVPGIRALLFGGAPTQELLEDHQIVIEGNTGIVEEFREAFRAG